MTPNSPTEPTTPTTQATIQVLEGLEAVRKRPGMYIGSTGPRGLHHLVYEIVDNSVDEALAGYCDTIDVTMREDGGVRVVDNGRGIPVDIHPVEKKSTVEVVLTVLHAGGKFGGGGYAVSGGLHGVGSSVVNALSTELDVEVRRQGHVWRQSFTDGVPVAPLAQGEDDRRHRHDDHLLAERRDLRDRRVRLRDAARALPADGLPQQGPAHHAHRRAPAARRRPDGTKAKATTSCYEQGLVDYVEYLNATKKAELVHPDIIAFESEDTESKISLEVAMQWNDLVPGERPHLREHDQHARGRHPRRGLPRRADDARQPLRPRRATRPHQGEGREPHRRRRPRGPHRRHLDQARRAAVRGPDEDQARQHRGEVVRAARRRRPAHDWFEQQPRRRPATSSARASRRRRRGSPPARRATRPAARACSSRAACPASSRTARARPGAQRDLHRRGRLGRRLGRAGPQPRDAGDPAAARQDPERREGAARPRARQQRGPGDDHGVRRRHRRGLRPRQGQVPQDRADGRCRRRRPAHHRRCC